ncbi:MAG: hypothetical protein JSS10_08450 [Verrucomicrobia bacterium]|nr:hypothetical protein [Verrucomicrobiota bacterium]
MEARSRWKIESPLKINEGAKTSLWTSAGPILHVQKRILQKDSKARLHPVERKQADEDNLLKYLRLRSHLPQSLG